MNLVADENIDSEIIDGLRDRGYEILSIAEDFSSIPDEEVLKIASEHNATLITGIKILENWSFVEDRQTKELY